MDELLLQMNMILDEYDYLYDEKKQRQQLIILRLLLERKLSDLEDQSG